MTLSSQLHHQEAIRIEQALGDPNQTDVLMSYRRVVELDEQEFFQEEFYQSLLSLGLNHHYVPIEFGGKFRSYEQLYALAKVLARRDLSTAVTMSTMIWSTLVWIGGDGGLKQRCAEITKSYNGAMCLAYSEERHGADLMANELTAVETEEGFVLYGEKWPINRASRSEVVMLLAKTATGRGPRNLSLFMVEKSKIDCSTFTYLPKVKTHGLRGCDICGIRFSGTLIPKSARIGNTGDGLEIALKTFQVTRTLCAGLSIGALEGNLRVVMDFARNRQLYRGNVFDIPNARHYLVGAFVDLLITDAMGTALSRALHVIPGQFSVLSVVAKVFAPYKLDAAQKDLSTVLGARFFFREKHKEGIFQKMLRDSQVVGLFDGSSEVNLYALTTQLPILARQQIKALCEPTVGRSEALATIFDTTQSLPRFDGQQLDLGSHGRDLILEQIPSMIADLEGASDRCDVVPVVLRLARRLVDKHRRNLNRILSDGINKIDPQSPAMFDLARQYCVVHAGVCAINYWIWNRSNADVFISDGHWLASGLQRLLLVLHIDDEDIPRSLLDTIADELLERSVTHKSYGLVALPLPEGNLQTLENVA